MCDGVALPGISGQRRTHGVHDAGGVVAVYKATMAFVIPAADDLFVFHGNMGEGMLSKRDNKQNKMIYYRLHYAEDGIMWEILEIVRRFPGVDAHVGKIIVDLIKIIVEIFFIFHP